jgi:hypothetical protein
MSTRKGQRLLNEDTIRRMMKLANTGVLVENFMDRTVALAEEDEDELAGEEPAAEFGAEEAPMGEPAPEGELGPEAPVDEEVVEDIVSAVVAAISDVTGVEASVEAAPEDGAEAPMEEPAAEEAPMEDPAAEEEAVAGRDYPANREDDEDLKVEVVDDDELTEAVLRRVVERLLRQRRK